MNNNSNQSDSIINRSMPPGTIIPELVYSDLDAAVNWLCQTFGFKERLRIRDHRAQLLSVADVAPEQWGGQLR